MVTPAARPLRVLYVSAEVSPHAKVGGLADVAAALPRALAARGHEVRVVTPDHGGRATASNLPAAAAFDVPLMGETLRINAAATPLESDVPLYLLGDPRHFSGDRVYGAPDDLLRYHCFSAAALTLPKALGWRPDVIHCNDWHTALIPFGLRNRAWADPFYRGAASVLTIHNLGYRGPDDLSDHLGQGIYYADAVTTVSPTYAREVLTAEYGQGLDTLLRLRGERFQGIVNGIDFTVFDPATDAALFAPYSAAAPAGKAVNKAGLQQSVGLQVDPDAPLAGVVSRLDYQKGIELVLAAVDRGVRELGMQFVILGSGDPGYQERLRALAASHPGAVHAEFGFAGVLAQRIYGGADLFLMPSRYEPCGLGQLIAMRYGTIPVVRRTGGLADTVADVTPDLAGGVGFVFDAFTDAGFWGALSRAAAAHRNRLAWAGLVARAMAQDTSWGPSAERYEALYRLALGEGAAGGH